MATRNHSGRRGRPGGGTKAARKGGWVSKSGPHAGKKRPKKPDKGRRRK